MTVETKESARRIERAGEILGKVRAEVGRAVVGQKAMVDRLLVGLLTGGHVLLEGVPGLAKTLAVKSLSDALSLRFRRIQFTPDLLPADLTGTMIYNPREGTFSAKRGPIFAHLVLADEINRAPATVQSALLEAMQEKQVTIGGTTYKLDEPFLVLATQNPIEQEGTYPLPEAQLDRFMYNIAVGYPSEEEELEIMRLTTSGFDTKLQPVLSGPEIIQMQQIVRRVPIADHVIRYAMSLSRATRVTQGGVPDFIKEWVQWGSGPRASQYLIVGAKAHAVLGGRFYVTVEDVRAVAHPVLRHRIIANFSAEAEGVTTDKIIDKLLEVIPAKEADLEKQPGLPQVTS